MEAFPQAFSPLKKTPVISYEDISEDIQTMFKTVLRFAESVSKRSQYELKHES